MKKFTALFITIITLTVLTGCNGGKDKVRFQPEKNGASLENSGEQASNPDTKEEKPTPVDPGKLEVITNEGKTLDTNVGYHVIRGTAPINTNKIVVNDYELHLFNPGDREWSYIAAENLETLKEGKNTYKVIAYNEAGDDIESVKFRIDYEKTEAPVLPDTGNNAWLVILLTIMATGAYINIREPQKI